MLQTECFMSLQNSYVGALTPSVRVLEGVSFGIYLDHEGGAPTWDLCLMRKDPRALSLLS